ncbi:hypothetical protein ABIA00_003414 [Bradyrhizobium ottawaense]
MSAAINWPTSPTLFRARSNHSMPAVTGWPSRRAGEVVRALERGGPETAREALRSLSQRLSPIEVSESKSAGSSLPTWLARHRYCCELRTPCTSSRKRMFGVVLMLERARRHWARISSSRRNVPFEGLRRSSPFLGRRGSHIRHSSNSSGPGGQFGPSEPQSKQKCQRARTPPVCVKEKTLCIINERLQQDKLTTKIDAKDDKMHVTYDPLETVAVM